MRGGAVGGDSVTGRSFHWRRSGKPTRTQRLWPCRAEPSSERGRARPDGDDARLEELQDAPRYSLRSRYSSAGERLAAINRRNREVGRYPEMTASEKNLEIRELSRERAEIAREVDREARAGE
ncbi:MAG: hypothetical protein IPK27_06745 [Rhodanobacteraceae bacterium]|nr:hypothetical protein [Rhodanobacteraceae bacterium]